jgi:hypothetical protein
MAKQFYSKIHTLDYARFVLYFTVYLKKYSKKVSAIWHVERQSKSVYVHTHIHTYIPTYTHIYKHIHIHIHIHTYIVRAYITLITCACNRFHAA